MRINHRLTAPETAHQIKRPRRVQKTSANMKKKKRKKKTVFGIFLEFFSLDQTENFLFSQKCFFIVPNKKEAKLHPNILGALSPRHVRKLGGQIGKEGREVGIRQLARGRRLMQ